MTTAYRRHLIDTKTKGEIAQMMKELVNNPKSKEGAPPFYIYNDKARDRMDDMAWAIYQLSVERDK